MSMERAEALQIIKFVAETYNLEFDESKGNTWAEFLMDNGDYERTMRKVKGRILDNIKYPPTLAEVIERPLHNVNKKIYNVEDDDEEYVDLSDPEVRQWIEELQEKYDAMAERGELTIHDL